MKVIVTNTPVLESLNIDTEKPTVTIVASSAGEGKTTILSVIATELANKGKKVLIIGDDDTKIWFRKLNNQHPDNNSTITYLETFHSYFDVNVKKLVQENLPIDVLILDTFCINERAKASELIEFVRTMGIITFMSQQQHKSAKAEPTIETISGPINKIQASDYIISLNRTPRLPFWQRVKYFFFGWFLKKPNVSLKILKNRHGKPTSANMFVDFNEINKPLIS